MYRIKEKTRKLPKTFMLVFFFFFLKTGTKFSDLEFNGTTLDKLFLVHEPFCERWVFVGTPHGKLLRCY